MKAATPSSMHNFLRITCIFNIVIQSWSSAHKHEF